jgi:hypothetical protein
MTPIEDVFLAHVMRAIYRVMEPEFDDIGQPLDQMRFIAEHHEIPLEAMAKAAIAACQ